MEIGSLADWFSGIVTSVGLILTVYYTRTQNNVKYDFGAYVNKDGVLIVSFINKSDFEVQIQHYGYIMRSRYKRTELSKNGSYFNKGTTKTIKRNNIDIYKDAYSNIVDIIGEKYKEKKVRIKPFILDTSGSYRSPKRTFLVKVNEFKDIDVFKGL